MKQYEIEGINWAKPNPDNITCDRVTLSDEYDDIDQQALAKVLRKKLNDQYGRGAVTSIGDFRMAYHKEPDAVMDKILGCLNKVEYDCSRYLSDDADAALARLYEEDREIIMEGLDREFSYGDVTPKVWTEYSYESVVSLMEDNDIDFKDE